MKAETKHGHVIDFLFPVVLFFILALSALTVILLAAGIYRSTAEDSALNDTSRASLSYVAEKIHQNDSEGAVYTGDFDGCEALVMKQSYNGEGYCTYIYEYDNNLMELFIKEGTRASAADGKVILKVKDFSMTSLSGGLIRFDCTDIQGREASIIAGLRTQPALGQ